MKMISIFKDDTIIDHNSIQLGNSKFKKWVYITFADKKSKFLELFKILHDEYK